MSAVLEALERVGVPAAAGGVALGAEFKPGEGASFVVRSPIDGAPLRTLHAAAVHEVDAAIEASVQAFDAWRCVPAPRRGELVRRLGELLRRHHDDLAAIVTEAFCKICAVAR